MQGSTEKGSEQAAVAGSSAPSHLQLHQLELPPHPEPRDLSGKPRLLGLAQSSTR